MNSATERANKSPWQIGVEAAKANFKPMVALWILAALMVGVYYLVPGAPQWFEPFNRWQAEHWMSAAFINRVIFCGVLPGIFLATIKALRPKRLWTTLIVETAYSGVWGIITDWFYRAQAHLFGALVSPGAVAGKLAFDQFVWTPLTLVISNAVFYFWISRDLSFAQTRRDWPAHFWRDVWAPNLLPNWCVWIPATLAIYVMPQTLQLQFSGVISAFWILMCLQIGLRSGKTEG